MDMFMASAIDISYICSKAQGSFQSLSMGWLESFQYHILAWLYSTCQMIWHFLLSLQASFGTSTVFISMPISPCQVTGTIVSGQSGISNWAPHSFWVLFTDCWKDPDTPSILRPNGQLGDYHCDSSGDLLTSVFAFMKSKMGDNIDFILWTG